MADQYYYETMLNMPCDGSNGSTSFVDASLRNAQITALGTGIAISTAQSVFGGASISFPGTSLTHLLNSTTWNCEIKDADYTIEFRVRFASVTGYQGLISLAIGNGSGPEVGKNASNQWTYRGAAVGSSTASANQWYHVALVRSNGVRTLYIDGVALAAGVSDTTSLVGINGFYLGRDTQNTACLNGFMDEIRFTRAARYTANFTPPASANDTGTLPVYPTYHRSAIDLVHAPFVSTPAFKYIKPDAKLFNQYFGGLGRISGTTKVKGTPNYAIRRKVRCHREADGLLVGEVWSDATTGAYTFNNIDASVKYTVIAYDYEHNYRAVIADNLTPDPMP